MDAMDILGSILGRRSKSKGSGGRILKDIFGRSSSRRESPSRQDSSTGSAGQYRQPNYPRGSRHDYDQESASELEEMLRVSRDHHHRERSRRRPEVEKPPSDYQPPTSIPKRKSREFEVMNEQSKLLVQAMVNAAKSDGQIDQAEQQHILGELDHVTQAEIDFLRSEFQRPLDVREFAWNVPIGLEQQVYSVSLMAIDLDEQKEAKYLAELARGLRIPPDTCNQIHRRFNAPEIFRT